MKVLTQLLTTKNIMGFKVNINDTEVTIIECKGTWYSITKHNNNININEVVSFFMNVNIKPFIYLYCFLLYLNGQRLSIISDLRQEVEKLYQDYYSNFSYEMI
jgi:hypothetical protein